MSVKETADGEAGREKRFSELRVSAILGFDGESWGISECSTEETWSGR